MDILKKIKTCKSINVENDIYNRGVIDGYNMGINEISEYFKYEWSLDNIRTLDDIDKIVEHFRINE